MKNQKLAVGGTAFLLALLIGFTGCKRKRNISSGPSGSEQPAAEASSAAVTTPAPTAVPKGSAIPATHPGEAQNPMAIKLAMDQFQRKMQRPPNDWQEMIDAKVIPAIPKRKDGQPLNFSEYTEFYIHRGGQAIKR